MWYMCYRLSVVWWPVYDCVVHYVAYVLPPRCSMVTSELEHRQFLYDVCLGGSNVMYSSTAYTPAYMSWPDEGCT